MYDGLSCHLHGFGDKINPSNAIRNKVVRLRIGYAKEYGRRYIIYET